MVGSSALQHYCRVCNIQLNSCRQAKIHSEGKKHCKRVNFLRLCIESGESDICGNCGYLWVDPLRQTSNGSIKMFNSPFFYR